MKIHKLKTLPSFYQDVERGLKNFEVRKDDRNYNVGDCLHLYYGTDEIDDEIVGRKYLTKYIRYILSGGQFGIKKGYCVMALSDKP